MALSQGTVDALQEAHDLFSDGELAHTKTLLQSTMTQNSQSSDDLFDVCCMRAAIAVMEGDSANTALELLPESTWKTVARNYLEGVGFLSRRSLHSATLKFEEILTADPNFALAHLGQAAISYQRGEYQSSFTSFRRTLECLGNNAPPLVRVGLALCAYQLKDSALALRCAERAMEMHPHDVLAKLVTLVLLVEARQIRRIVTTVSELRRLAPKNTTVLLRVADISYFNAVAQGTLRQRAPSLRAMSMEVLRGSVTTAQEAYAKFQAGRVSHATGDLNEAKALLLEAVVGLPSLTAAWIHLSKVHYKLGEKAEAEQRLKWLDKHAAPEREVVEMLLVLSSEEGHHELAMEYARRLAAMAPNEASTLRLSAWAHRLDKAGALQLLQRTAQQFTEQGKAVPWVLRADIAGLRSDAEPTELEALIKEREGAAGRADEPSLAPMLFNLALRLEALDAEAATHWYKTLVRRFPTFPQPYYRLQNLANTKGCYKQALQWMSLLQQVRPDDSMFAVSSAASLSQSGNPIAAVNILTSVAKRGGNHTHIALAMGSMYLWSAQQTSRKALRYLQYAKNRFDYALTKDPANLLGAHGLASCAGTLSWATETQLALERIRELPPNDPYVVGGMQDHMANVLVACDSFSAARVALDAIKDKTPGQYSALAFCHTGTHDYDSAIQTLEVALQAHPQSSSLVYNAALVYCAGVMHSLLPQSCSYLPAETADKLHKWMSAGLRHAHTFVASKPTNMAESSLAAQQFVSLVAHHTYSLKDRMARLQRAGAIEKVRTVRGAEGWRQKFEERQQELRDVQLGDEERRQQEELELAETYAAIQQRQLEALGATQGSFDPTQVPRAQDVALMDYDEFAKRDRDDEGVATLDELGLAATLALGGIYVDDPPTS